MENHFSVGPKLARATLETYNCHIVIIFIWHLAVLGVTRYLCNALRNIITFVVTK